jgi:simple sugar transport system substrate-binding protein
MPFFLDSGGIVEMKRVQILISLFVILVIVFSTGCQPATSVQPASTTGTDSGDQICSGVNIVFFPGGDAGTPFTNNVYNGARQAEKDLGAKVDYVFSGWSPERMVQQLKEAAAKKPDGIAIMGHPGDDAYGPVVDEAIKQGIIVTSQNTDLPKLEAAYQSEGFGYVGATLYNAGFNLATESIKRAGLKAGDKAMVWGLLSQPGRGQRTKGVVDGLEQAGIKVEYLEIDEATNKDASAGTPTFTGYITANPDTKLVVTDHGALTATVETYLKAAGKGADDVYAAGFDLSPATLAAIRGGWVDLVIDQQPYLQGYIPILQICLTKKYGFAGMHIDTGSGFASKDNVEFLAPLVEKEIR